MFAFVALRDSELVAAVVRSALPDAPRCDRPAWTGVRRLPGVGLRGLADPIASSLGAALRQPAPGRRPLRRRELGRAGHWRTGRRLTVVGHRRHVS
jgi:hypothetical protein